MKQKTVEKLSIHDSFEKMQENEASITMKDLKEEFLYHVACILLKPSTTNIGKMPPFTSPPYF